MVQENITLKQVLSKIKNMDDTHKFEWVHSLLKEFGSEVTSKLYHEGYEQGKFDEAMNNTYKVNRVEIPDYIAHWLEYSKLTNVDFVRSFLVDKYCLYNYARQSDLPKIKEWFKSNKNQNTFIDAWVNGYTVKETHYYVAVPVGGSIYKRVCSTCTGTLYLGEYNYHSLNKLKVHSKQAVTQITESMIKESPLSWTWQFAKELED